MRRLLRTRTRRLTAALITAATALLALLALLAPGVSYAAGQSTAAAHDPSSLALAVDGCTGVTPAVFPAMGFITDPDRSQAGHLWWRPEADGVCIGTVVEFVQYNTTQTKTWQVIVYSAGHPGGQVVAARTFSLGPGWYYFGFGVHQVFSGLSQVCITADDSFGESCIDIGQSQLGTFRWAQISGRYASDLRCGYAASIEANTKVTANPARKAPNTRVQRAEKEVAAAERAFAALLADPDTTAAAKNKAIPAGGPQLLPGFWGL